MIGLPGVAIQSQIYESPASLVYRGVRVQDNRAIVIKLLKQEYPSPQELTRYRQEYEITRSLNLAGVVKVYSQQDYQRTLAIFLEDFGGNQSNAGCVLAQGVSRNVNAIGYFGFGYYQANANQLRPLAINSGKGAVLPSVEAVQTAKYQQFSRPLFIYINLASTQKKPQLKAFVEAYLKNADHIVKQAGYIPLPPEGYRLAQQHFYEGKFGTVFAGEPHPGITIDQLLKKQALF